MRFLDAYFYWMRLFMKINDTDLFLTPMILQTHRKINHSS